MRRVKTSHLLSGHMVKLGPLAKAQAMIILSSFFWGSSFVVIRFGLEEMDPYWFASIRLWLSGAGAMLLVYLVQRRLSLRHLREWDTWALGLLNGLAFLCQFVGLQYTTASKGALLININVVFIALLSMRFLKERMGGFLVAALFLGLVGVFLVTTDGDLGSLVGGERRGDLIIFAAGIIWSFYIVLQKRMVATRDVNVMELTTWIVLITSIVTFIPVLSNPSIPSISLTGWLLIVYLAAFCTLGAFILWIKGLQRLPATSTSILVLLEVLWALFLAWWFLGENITFFGAIGGVLIVFAAILINIRPIGYPS